MKEYTGDYLEIGPSKPSGKWRQYTYIKIGTETIKSAYIDERLSIVLRDQVKRGGHAKLWIIQWAFRPLIIGITQNDGQTFRQSLFTQYGFAGICLAIAAGTLMAWDIGKFILPLALLGAWLNIGLISKIKKIPADHIY